MWLCCPALLNRISASPLAQPAQLHVLKGLMEQYELPAEVTRICCPGENQVQKLWSSKVGCQRPELALCDIQIAAVLFFTPMSTHIEGHGSGAE